MDKRNEPPGIIFFGMFGILSAVPLQKLIDRGCRIDAIVMPVSSVQRRVVTISEVSPETVPVADAMLHTYDQRTIVHIAWERRIPLLEVGRLSARETASVLASYRSDVFCVSCFPWLLPASVRRIPTCGSVNLHPSLLPAYRGPDPLFWAFRNGERETGVTVHFMDDTFDTGAIISRQSIPLPDGITRREAEQACADAGRHLLADAVYTLHQGKAVSQPQDEARSSYYSRPSPTDFEITPEWAARRAYNFICGATGGPYAVEMVTEEARYRIRNAIGWREDDDRGETYRRTGDLLEVPCTPGILEVRI